VTGPGRVVAATNVHPSKPCAVRALETLGADKGEVDSKPLASERAGLEGDLREPTDSGTPEGVRTQLGAPAFRVLTARHERESWMGITDWVWDRSGDVFHGDCQGCRTPIRASLRSSRCFVRRTKGGTSRSGVIGLGGDRKRGPVRAVGARHAEGPPRPDLTGKARS